MGDIDEARASKLQAMVLLMGSRCYYEDEGGVRGSFTVTHKGVEVYVEDIEESFEDVYHPIGFFFEESAVCCSVRVAAHLYTAWFVANSWQVLAERILNAMDDEDYCCFCGILGVLEGRTMCTKCALAEMPQPCRSCGKKHGRPESMSMDIPEHSVCKKRRLE